MNDRPHASWIDDVAALNGLEPEARALVADLQPMTLEAGRVLFSPGAACSGFAMVLSGVVRVGVNSDTGRALVLYRVSADEVCVQTTLCLMAGLEYSAEGVTETPVRLVMIPAARFDRLMAVSRIFRTFVFQRFGARMQDISKRHGGGPAPQIIRAMENLKTALRLRVGRGPLSSEELQSIAATIDAAALSIEKT